MIRFAGDRGSQGRIPRVALRLSLRNGRCSSFRGPTPSVSRGFGIEPGFSRRPATLRGRGHGPRRSVLAAGARGAAPTRAVAICTVDRQASGPAMRLGRHLARTGARQRQVMLLGRQSAWTGARRRHRGHPVCHTWDIVCTSRIGRVVACVGVLMFDGLWEVQSGHLVASHPAEVREAGALARG